jgi:hypothetical protein
LAVLTIVLTVGSATASHAAPVSLGSTNDGRPARVVVDSGGQGYVSWSDEGAGSTVDFCRLPSGATSCAPRLSFAFGPGAAFGTDKGNSPLLTAAGQVAIIDSRCCESSNEKFLLLSADGGSTFAGPSPIVSDHASGMTGNAIDLPPGALYAGSPEQVLTSDASAVSGGGSIQATGLAQEAADPGWFTPGTEENSLSGSVGLQGSTLVAVYTTASPPRKVRWVKYLGAGSPNSSQSWSPPAEVLPAPSLSSNAQLAGGPSGIFMARGIATAGDNEELAVQKFTGSGWSSPVALTSKEAGESFAIAESPAGFVYVIWKDSGGSLKYAISKSTAGTSFGAAQTLPTVGNIGFPEIAVDASGAGWATWTNESSPAQIFALPILPAPNSTRVGLSDGSSVSLGTPRGCVAPGASFKVTLGFKASKRKGRVYIKPSKVAFSVSGSAVKSVRHAPFRATLTITASTAPGSTVTVRARATLKTHHGKPPTKSIYAKVGVCS